MSRQPQVGDIWVWAPSPIVGQHRLKVLKSIPFDDMGYDFTTGRTGWAASEILQAVAGGDLLYPGSSLLRKLLGVDYD